MSTWPASRSPHRLHAALVRHQHHVEPGARLQHARGDRGDGLHSDAGVAELAGMRLGVVDELLQRGDRQRSLHAENLRPGAELRHRNEILVRIVADLLHQRRQGQLRAGAEQERVAVGRGARDLPGGDDPAGAAEVLDHERLVEPGRESLGREPRHHVGIPAGDERHDDGHRPRRPVARRREGG